MHTYFKLYQKRPPCWWNESKLVGNMNTNSHGWWPNNIEFLTLIFSPSWRLLSSSSTRAHYVSKFNAKHTQKPHCWMGVEKELQIVASKPRAVSRNLKPICFQYFFLPKMNISDASRSLELLGFNSSGRKSPPSPKKLTPTPNPPKRVSIETLLCTVKRLKP